MARKITDAQLEEMFIAWQEKQTLRHVARKCTVSLPTVRRYKKLEKWDERLEVIKVRATRKANTEITNHRAKHAKIGQLLQSAGVKRIQNIMEDPATNAIKQITPKVAGGLIKTGVDIEREAVGDVSPDTVIVLALPVGLEGL